MQYKIIYADPPWQFKAWSDKGLEKSAENHYHTESIEDLKSMPVAEILDKDCVLLMWATFPCLQEAMELGKSWGFIYKTVAFTWVKMNKNNDTPFMGMGYYTRANAEIVLLFTKGKPLDRISRSVEQVIFAKVGKHSQKPPIVREKIVELFGDLPRVELFARSRDGFFPDEEYKGWAVFGNQVNNSIKL